MEVWDALMFHETRGVNEIIQENKNHTIEEKRRLRKIGIW